MVPCAALTGMRLPMAQHPGGFWNQPGKHGGVLLSARPGAETAWAGALPCSNSDSPLWAAGTVCEQPQPEMLLPVTWAIPLCTHQLLALGLALSSCCHESTLGPAENSAFAGGFSQKKAQTEPSFKDHHHNAGLTEISRLGTEHFEKGDQVKSREEWDCVDTCGSRAASLDPR